MFKLSGSLIKKCELSSNYLLKFVILVKSAAFQYEKASNIAKVEQLHMMEKDLYGMSRELEKLQVEVQNAEMRAHGNLSSYCTLSYISFFFYSYFLNLYSIFYVL